MKKKQLKAVISELNEMGYSILTEFDIELIQNTVTAFKIVEGKTDTPIDSTADAVFDFTEMGEFIENELEFLCGMIGTKLKKDENQQEIKTKFKEGDTVWDGVMFPGIKGKVIDMDDEHKRPMYVVFNITENLEGAFSRNYTLDGCPYHGSKQTLLHHNYEIGIRPLKSSKNNKKPNNEKETNCRN